MDSIEICLVSADELLTRYFNPPDFKNTFLCDWKTEEIKVPIKSAVSTPEQNPRFKVYKRAPDQIRHRRTFNYDGLETWTGIRVIVFKEIV